MKTLTFTVVLTLSLMATAPQTNALELAQRFDTRCGITQQWCIWYKNGTRPATIVVAPGNYGRRTPGWYKLNGPYNSAQQAASQTCILHRQPGYHAPQVVAGRIRCRSDRLRHPTRADCPHSLSIGHRSYRLTSFRIIHQNARFQCIYGGNVTGITVDYSPVFPRPGGQVSLCHSQQGIGGFLKSRTHDVMVSMERRINNHVARRRVVLHRMERRGFAARCR
jgi:hypothetical protein